MDGFIDGIIQRELYMDAQSIIATDLWMERFIDGIIIYGWIY